MNSISIKNPSRGLDIIVCLNLKHIANSSIRHFLREIIEKLGFETPEISKIKLILE